MQWTILSQSSHSSTGSLEQYFERLFHRFLKTGSLLQNCFIDHSRLPVFRKTVSRNFCSCRSLVRLHAERREVEREMNERAERGRCWKAVLMKQRLAKVLDNKPSKRSSE